MPGRTQGSRIPYGDPMSSLFLAALARAPAAVACPEQRAAASQQPRAGKPGARPGARALSPLQGVTGGRGSCPERRCRYPGTGGARGLFPAQRSPAAIGPLGSTGAAQAHPSDRIFPCHGPLGRVSAEAPHRTTCSDLEPQGSCSARGARRAPALVPSPRTPLLLSSPAHLRDWGACSKAKRGRPKPQPGQCPARSEPYARGQTRQGRGGCPERRTVAEGKVVYEREVQGEGERTGPNRGCTGAGRASRAGLVTWGTRPNQDPPRARGRAHARYCPAALPECHVRGQGPRETAALTNRERHREERSQW